MKFLLIGNGFIMPEHKKAIQENGGEVLDIIKVRPKNNERIL